MTNNTAEAEDLTQEAFMQVFRKLSTFRGDAALSSWLYRIAVNTVLMHFRKKNRRHISLDEAYNNDKHLVRREYGSQDNHLSGCMYRIALTRAIGELPNGYRRIFLLHEVGGYEHQEIADLLDCSIGNSKSQLHKAKRKIREFLGQAGAEVHQGKQQEVASLPMSTSDTDYNSRLARMRSAADMTGRPVTLDSFSSASLAACS
jgi:RNA polymerase sigma-70 factor (ECF subfamily)